MIYFETIAMTAAKANTHTSFPTVIGDITKNRIIPVMSVDSRFAGALNSLANMICAIYADHNITSKELVKTIPLYAPTPNVPSKIAAALSKNSPSRTSLYIVMEFRKLSMFLAICFSIVKSVSAISILYKKPVPQ
jgi:hypothetical protein